MQVTETTSEGLKRELTVVIGAEELDSKLNQRLDELKDRVEIKGFRKGKVPLAHLRKVYGRSVMAEIVQQAVSDASRKALDDRDERPAFEPEISFTEDESEIEKVMDGKADLSYKMSFEILPPIEVSDLSKIELEREVAEITDQEVDNGIAKLVDSAVTYLPKEGAAETGDQLTIDFVGKMDGVPFDGGTAEDAQVVIGRGAFIPGFEEGLEGASKGEERELNLTFPETYQVKDLAGKEALFEVKVKEVASPVRPEVNDEFAKMLGLEDVEKLREAVKARIGEEFQNASRLKLKRYLLDKLEESHDFELPPTLVEKEFEAIWIQITSQLNQAGRTFEDEDMTEEGAREEYRRVAERRIRLGLLLSEIGDRNEIKISDEEVKQALFERAREFPGQEKQVLEYYQKNPRAVAELRAPIFEEKVVNFIFELAKVKEKSVSSDELFNMPDGDEEKAETDK